MKKPVFSFFVCLSFLAATWPGAAEEVKPAASVVASLPSIQVIPPGDDKIVPLKKGEPAPYDGQFFDNNTALRWGNWLLQYKFRLKADVELTQKLGATDVELWKNKYSLVEEKYTLVTKDYQKRVADLETQTEKLRFEIANPSWYRSPLFGFVLGVVVTGLCVGAGIYTYHVATK